MNVNATIALALEFPSFRAWERAPGLKPMPNRQRVIDEIEGLLSHTESLVFDTAEKRDAMGKAALNLLRRTLPYLREEQILDHLDRLETACIVAYKSTAKTQNPKVRRITDHPSFTFAMERIGQLLGVDVADVTKDAGLH